MSIEAEVIYHLVASEDWERARREPRYAAPSLETEGFLHASASLDQLLWVANRLFREVASASVLVIERRRVEAEVRDEMAGAAGPFPHIYGPLNTSAVLEVRRLARDGAGTFIGFEGVRRM